MSSNSQSGLDEVKKDGDTVIVQPQEVKTVSEKDYVELQSAYTRNRQERIDEVSELVQLKPEKLKDMRDNKLRDAVVKKLYGYDSYETLVALNWDDFAKSEDDNDETDQLVVAQKKIRELDYKMGKKELDDAVEKYRSSNPDYFRSEDSEDVLREKLSLISGSIKPDERVKMAAAIAFGSPVDPVSLAYKFLNSAPAGWNWNSAPPSDKKKTDENQDKILEFLKLKKQ